MPDKIIVMTEQEFSECREEYIGICRTCHARKEGCEPDARRYECDECGDKQVYGAEELLIMGMINFKDE